MTINPEYDEADIEISLLGKNGNKLPEQTAQWAAKLWNVPAEMASRLKLPKYKLLPDGSVREVMPFIA